MGEATARLFAIEGAAIVIGDIEDELALEVVESLTVSGGQAASCQVDVRQPTEVESLVNLAVEYFGGGHPHQQCRCEPSQIYHRHHA